MGTIKDRNGKDLTEAEETKWQEYIEELDKKSLNDSDNHIDAVNHLELDILELEVEWALGSITMYKITVGDGIPAELFKILNALLLKCYTENASNFGKLSSGHRTQKGQFSFQSQRRAMPKIIHNARTIALMLVRLWSKSFKLAFVNIWTKNFQI